MSPLSNEASGIPAPIPLATPTGLVATPGNALIVLSWSPTTGATSYDVYRATITGGESTALTSGLTGTFYADSGVTNGTTYFYTVSAVNGCGTSGPSNEASATPLSSIPAVPTGLTATGGNMQVTLTWGPVAASSYTIYRGTYGEAATPVATSITATTYTDTGLINYTPYYYSVAAVNANGTSFQSGEVWATPVGPPSPVLLSATAGNAEVSLSWTPANWSPVTYNVYRGTDSDAEGQSPIQSGLTGTTCTDTAVTNGTVYYYTVDAVDAGGTGEPSNEASATPEALTPPTGLTATAGNAQVTLSWTATTGATSYNIFRSTIRDAEGDAAMCSAAGTTYIDTGLTDGLEYYYKVASASANGTSLESVEVSTTLIPAVPTSLTATPGNAQVSLSWAASLGATSYRVYYSTTSGVNGRSAIDAPTSSAFTDTGLTDGVAYYFTIAAVDAGGTSAQSSEV